MLVLCFKEKISSEMLDFDFKLKISLVNELLLHINSELTYKIFIKTSNFNGMN